MNNLLLLPIIAMALVSGCGHLPKGNKKSESECYIVTYTITLPVYNKAIEGFIQVYRDFYDKEPYRIHIRYLKYTTVYAIHFKVNDKTWYKGYTGVTIGCDTND